MRGCHQKVYASEVLFKKMDEAVVPESFGNWAIGISGDMAGAITDIRREIS